MQDFATIPGIAGCIFGGASAAGGGGRLGGYSSPAVPVKCPRCDSTDTKFCYYNNYNLAQPRHFCKSCRRYWTKGGLLRNVPVGGGCRKSKRTPCSSSRNSASTAPQKDPPLRRSSPAADAYTSVSLPNSALLVTNSDTGSIPSNSFKPAAGMEAPLVQAAEIFADTTAVAGNTTGLISPVPAPMFNNFSRPPPIPLHHQTAAEDIGIGTQPGFMEHVAPLIALQLQSTAAEEVGVQPGLIEQAAPPVPLQLQSEAAEESGVQAVFIDQAAPHIPLQLQPAAAAEEVGALPGFMNPAVSAASGIEWSGAEVDPALFGLSAAAYWGNGHWGDADPALYLS